MPKADKLDKILKVLDHHTGLLDRHTAKLVHIEETMTTKDSLDAAERRLAQQIEGVAGEVKKLIDDTPATNKRISRVEFRTKKILGPEQAKAVDAEFEYNRHA